MKDYEVKKEGSVLTITLGEELAVSNAPALMDELVSYKEQGVEKVVFNATDLQYLSSSGVRVILYCKKYLSANSNIVFVNCNKDVLEVLDLVGILPYITFNNSSSAT
jgi:anti-sigma B factor antagonist